MLKDKEREKQNITLGKTRLDTFNNHWYKPGKSILVRGLWFFINAICFINPLVAGSGWRASLLRLFGAKIGKQVVIKPGVNIKYPWLLSIGDHCWIGERVWIDNLAKVTIEDHVCLSQGAFLLTGNHNYKKASFDLMIGEIYLEEGVWIGAKSIVCPGIKCRSHAVLAVNSVAASDLEAYTIYQGNPAQPIRKRKVT